MFIISKKMHKSTSTLVKMFFFLRRCTIVQKHIHYSNKEYSITMVAKYYYNRIVELTVVP